MLVVNVHKPTKQYTVHEMTVTMSRTHMTPTVYSAKKAVREFLTKYFKEWEIENIPTYRIKI